MKRKYLTLSFIFIAVVLLSLTFESMNDIEDAVITAFVFFCGLIVFSVSIFIDIRRDKIQIEPVPIIDPETGEEIESLVDDVSDIFD